MRSAALVLALLASAASAQVADSVASSDVARRVLQPLSDPVAVELPSFAVHAGASTLGYLAGGAAGYYVGDSLDDSRGFILVPSDGAALGILVGTTLGAAAFATATGDRRGFWRALGGAAAGQFLGLAALSLESPLTEAVFYALPVAAGVGAVLGNRYGAEPRARVPAPDP